MGNNPEKMIAEICGKTIANPLAFVLAMFDWGHGELKEYSGPDKWQTAVLKKMGTWGMRSGKPFRLSVASGHGIGKTALSAWIILWFISTRKNPQIVVTANTKNQLETKTWRELAKWHKLIHNRDWFKWIATRLIKKDSPENWYAAAIPQNKDNSEAFAGTHEKDVLMLYDEASLIDDKIWEVSEGAMTTPGAMWVAFGNPTKNTGRFKECFGKFKHRWHTMQVDSRDSKMAEKKQIQEWIDDYGEDSDFVKVRVRGVFPSTSTSQFISESVVCAASRRIIPYSEIHQEAVIMGVDPARFGDDQSIIYIRAGKATLKILKYREKNSIELAQIVAYEAKDVVDEAGHSFGEVDAIFVDAGGIGSGVIDHLDLLTINAVPVQFGSSSPDRYYLNLRGYIWGQMKKWLERGGQIPDDSALMADLIGPEYSFNNRDKLVLESKKDMKRRGLPSPDNGDGLALTFAGGMITKGGGMYVNNDPLGRNNNRCITDKSTVRWNFG